MIVVKRKLGKNHHKIFKPYIIFLTESIMKELGNRSPALATLIYVDSDCSLPTG